jgi:hypothetical protein
VAEFRYLDFAGESFREAFTNQSDPEAKALRGRLQRADILMAILDGQHVKWYLEGKPDPAFRRSFLKDLSTLLDTLSDHEQPVNLMISKWDVFENGLQLAEVVDGLFKIDRFTVFVESRERNGGCLLIPVSAVGYGVAYEADDGKIMRKTAGALLQPFQVEIPIACALPSLLKAPEPPANGSLPRKAQRWAKKMNPQTNFRISSMDIGAAPFKVTVARDVPQPAAAAPIHPYVLDKFYAFCYGQKAALTHNMAGADLAKFMDVRKAAAAAQPTPLPKPTQAPTPPPPAAATSVPTSERQPLTTTAADRIQKVIDKFRRINQ